ncbi:hypothetical protein BDU57DRAFT_536923 [Ampelomyces quisqualis]|uniref:Uncharacterized protein n=1 Tax=Ampelomyces quisqualis TaxID=50730 RepID=A0A6A5QYT8_AMPQU|nr:hypothetical protein BDU57DRAFT_536923 [Ampelomyces quisqualis]
MRPSILSARCAALSSSIARVILEISQFARKVRDARNDLNAINNELMIIRTGLGIAQDDFSNPRSVFPITLVDAFSQILDSCELTRERLHKTFVKLSRSLLPQDDWQACKENSLTDMRQDLEGSNMVLDLSLDYLALYVQMPGQETTIDSFLGGYPENFSTATGELLKKINIEEEQGNHIGRQRLPSLLQAIRLLRSCITAMARKKTLVPRTTAPRPDSLEPSLGEGRRRITSTLGSMASSGDKGIGTWLAGIPPLEDAKPLHHSRIGETSRPLTSCRSKSRPSLRNDMSSSCGTFVTDDDNASANETLLAPELRLKKARSWSSETTAQCATHSSSTTKVPSKYTPSIASSNVSIIYKRITCDKIAIAKGNRKDLDVSSRVGVDRILAHVPAEAMSSDIEQILWQGANPMVTHPEFGFFFIRAAYEMSSEVLKVLVDFGADITKTLSPPNPYYSTMHAAALGGQLETIKYLTTLGHSIDSANVAGETPLILAMRTPGAYDVAKYLLDLGADVNHETENGESPLYLALTSKALEGRERSQMIELLVSHGAKDDILKYSDRDRYAKGRSILGIA